MTELPMDRVRAIVEVVDAVERGDLDELADDLPTMEESRTLARMVLALTERVERLDSENDRLTRRTTDLLNANKGLGETIATGTAQLVEAAGLVAMAYRDGYDDGCDPSWCDKQLRRAGVTTEAHTAEAREFFWDRSEAKERLAALTTPTGGTDGQ